MTKKPHPMYSISKVAGVNIMLTQAERRRARKRYLKWKKGK